jgi:quercetin dioxygenase-like cupin family protein
VWNCGGEHFGKKKETGIPTAPEDGTERPCLSLFLCCGGPLMGDTTIKKVEARTSPAGEMGQKYLASGTSVSMRLWTAERLGNDMPATRRDYETVGYVIAGRAELDLEDQTIRLGPGDSWLVPKGSGHKYRIIEPFTAVEAIAPPAQVHARDTKVQGEG